MGLLLNFHKLELTVEELLKTICELSYKGDVRMRLKMENPKKVESIVRGSADGLREIYLGERLRQLEQEGIVEMAGEEVLKLKHCNRNLGLLLEGVPASVKRGMKPQVNALSVKEVQEDLRKNLEKKVLETSLNMVLSGMYSTNPLKNLSYVYSKFKKGRK